MTKIRRVAKNGNINHSIVGWCFQDHWSMDKLIPIAKQLGCGSVELIGPEFYPTLKQHDMELAIAGIDIGVPPFTQGFNNPKYHEKVIAATKKSIDECHAFGWKKVIAFTGYEEGLSKAEGAENCIQGLKEAQQIKAALTRIEEGTFGLCVQCDEEIPEKRLELLPHTPLCTSCMSGAE